MIDRSDGSESGDRGRDRVGIGEVDVVKALTRYGRLVSAHRVKARTEFDQKVRRRCADTSGAADQDCRRVLVPKSFQT